MSKPLRRNVGVAVNGPGGAALRAETVSATANWTTLVSAMPTTKAVANGPVAAIAWGAFWAIIIADSGPIDGFAGRNAFAGAHTAGGTAFAGDPVEGAGTAAVVEDVVASATVADGPAASAASGASKCGITGIWPTGERPRRGGAGRASLFPPAAACAVSSAGPVDAAERGGVGCPRNPDAPAALPSEAEPRAGWVGRDAAARPPAVSTPADESCEPGSAAAMPQPAHSAAPTPTATASPRT